LTTPSGSQDHPNATQITSTSFQITAIFSTGKYSLVVTNPNGQSSSAFSISANVATGITFAQRVDLSTGGTNSISIAMADFNGDGKLDIAVSNENSNTITVFLNNGDGTFKDPIATTVQTNGALNIGAIVTGDFNEDGKPDLVVATIAGGQSNLVLLGKGDGTFQETGSIPNSFGFFQAKAVDVNGDKHLDIVAGANGNLSVALGKGDGTFGSANFLPNGPLFNSDMGIDVGDVTGDGKLDIVGADWEPNAGDIVVFNGIGDGTFNAPTWQTPAFTSPESVALADFNGDGKLDVLVGYSEGSAAIGLGIGNGNFYLDESEQLTVYSALPQYGNGIYVQAADLDQDGKPDALVLDYLAGVFTVALNNAKDISSGTKYAYSIAPGLADLAVGDLNGDGVPDVVLVNNKTNMISVFLSKSE
jgi:hypothetical protein